MTLKQKREIVREFAKGESLAILDVRYTRLCGNWPTVWDVLRDFINRKFTLEKGRK